MAPAPASNNVALPAPELRPAKNNLVDVAERGQGSVRWERGGGFPEFACFKGNVQAPQCPAEQLTAPQTCQPSELFYPVLLEESVAWDTLTYEDAVKAAIEALDTATSALLEGEIELGTIGTTAGLVNPTLSSATNLGPSASGGEAVGKVQDALYDPTKGASGMGTLFMSYSTAIAADVALDDDDTGRVFTKYGQWPVVIGYFTPGTVYGVPGLVDLYLGGIETTEFFERSTNEMIVTAQRLALVTFHTCNMVRTGVVTAPTA
jgi:hypothetical protein